MFRQEELTVSNKFSFNFLGTLAVSVFSIFDANSTIKSDLPDRFRLI